MNFLFSIIFFINAYTCEEATVIQPSEFCSFLPSIEDWFTFNIPQGGTVSVITAGFDDGEMTLYSGSCSNLEFLDYDDDSGPMQMPQIQFTADPTKTYYVKVQNAEYFEICVFVCNPLPVQLLTYKLYEKNSYIKLSWTTASEINNKYFSIYSSEDFNNWKLLTQVPGANNSNSLLYYSYYDNNEWNEKLIYYKLTQTDYNGEETILGILPLISKKEYKVLLKEIDIKGNPINKQYNGIKVKVYSNGTVEKTIEL